jgi:hypothetical protein
VAVAGCLEARMWVEVIISLIWILSPEIDTNFTIKSSCFVKKCAKTTTSPDYVMRTKASRLLHEGLYLYTVSITL